MKTLFGWFAIVPIAGLIVVVNLYLAENPVDISPVISSSETVHPLDSNAPQSDDSTIKQLTELTFVQTFSRPLFSPDRRKFQPAPPPPPTPAPKPVAIQPKPKKILPPPNLRLLGVSISSESSRALIDDGSNNSSQWFTKGDRLGNWVLKDIEKNTITISFEDQILTIDLYPKEN